MIALLIAVLLGADPGDDFLRVVEANAKEMECEAVRVFRAETADSLRFVIFRCKKGDVAIPFFERSAGDWVPVPWVGKASSDVLGGERI